MIAFAEEWDPLPIHLDDDASPQGVSAAGVYLIAIRMKLIHRIRPRMKVLVSFGFEDLRYLRPAYPGERLTLTYEYVEKRASRSKPHLGIVTLREALVNGDGAEVLSLRDVVLVERRPA